MRPIVLLPPLLSLIVAALPAATPPQQDPQPETLQVEVVTQDGTPTPGVMVGVLPISAGHGEGLRSGWLHAHDLRLAQLAAAHHWPTDGNGIATVAWPGDPHGRYELSVAPPHRLLATLPGNDGARRLVVRRLEPFVVRVVDVAGAPLARFPLGLYGNQQLESVARTDEHGMATFGVEPRYQARLAVVPFGWVGPHEGFPTVAQQLPGRVTTLMVPPHGRVRVRALVHGRPAATAVRGASLTAPVRCEIGRARDPDVENCQGVLFEPVPLGEPVRGELRVRRLVLPFAAPALRKAGEEIVVDVETEPPRPQFVARLAGAPASLHLARFLVHTDAGTFLDMPTIAADGRVLARFDRTDWNGTHVRHVELTAVELGSAGEPRVWSGRVAVDQALTPTTIDVGVLAIQSQEPALRGRVVDEHGKPVAGALVDVEAAPGSAAVVRCTVTSDAHGSFVLLQPIGAQPDGGPMQLVATAHSPFGAGVASGAPSAPQPVGSDVTLVLGAPSRGYVHVEVAEPGAVSPAALLFQFVAASGRTLALPPDHVRPAGGRSGRLRLGPLPLGRGRLRVLLRSGAEVASCEGIDVVPPTALAMARAEPAVILDLAARVRVCRLRIVDAEAVPIRGAMLSVRDGSSQLAVAGSDEGGYAEFLLGRDQRARLQIEAPGCQLLQVDDPIDGGQVQLLPRRRICVTVVGLPAELPRDRIEVMLRSVVRENLGDSTQAQLDGSDTAAVPLPRAGGYRVLLVVRQQGRADRDGGSGSWTTVGERAEPVAIVDGIEPSAIEFAVDEAILTRLRAAQAEPLK